MSVYTQELEKILISTDDAKIGDIIKMVLGGDHTNHDYGGCIVRVIEVKEGIIHGTTIKGYQHGTGNWWTIGENHWRFKKMIEWDD